MYYPEDVVEEVRTRNDIVDVISGYVKLQKKGSNYFGLCPFHNEKSPSFSVSPQKQMYYCFGCGAGGNVITFVMEYENYSFPEALKLLAERAGIHLPEVEYSKEERAKADKRSTLLEINKLAANYFYYQLHQPQGKIGYDYFRKRELSDDTIRHFGLGFANKTSNDLYQYLRSKGYTDEILRDSGLVTMEERSTYDKFWNRVMFPIMDVNNRVIGFGGRVMGDGTPKYLNSPETMIFDKSRNLYGLNYARTSREKYILACEGYMDVIAMHQAGFTNAVASLGTAFTTQHAVLLKRYTDTVILTYDSDGAGVKAALRAIPILKEVGISTKVLNLKPYKDPDEFIKNLGADAFRERIANAQNSFLYEIDVMKREYDLEDPEQKTRFYNAVARKLLEFGEALERDNYTRAVAQAQFIPYEDLRRLVNRLGNQLGPVPLQKREEDRTDPRERKKKKEKDDGIRRSQRLLLTWLIERPQLFEKIAGIIDADDFREPLYHEVAQMVFDGHKEGNLNPAGILNRFINDEEQYKQVAALFNASLNDSLNNEEQRKAFSETVLKVKKNSLDEASRSATDIAALQQIIRQQAALKTLQISID
ncbi:DNA primase [Clostridium sp. OM02-18AC]|uniref:DNA primase n=1 Tax=Clostridium sp. OM02-18AC TaxID=2292311 RepID=UPI000E5437C4|nr:DNA primase [Clostridium sp. OM02-18AC]RHV65949.1 DNA primase [Clostridium sp. OM02-18AC]